MHTSLPTSLALMSLALAACGTAPAPLRPSAPPLTNSAAPERPASPYEAALLAAVKDYTGPSYGLVMTTPDRSPLDCSAPSFDIEPTLSDARTTDGGHGHKLYYLYARDVHAYRVQTGLFIDYGHFMRAANAPERPQHAPITHQAVGQVIVKEAWTDVPLAEGAPRPPPRSRARGGGADMEAHAYIDGVAHAIGERSALFVMMKVAADAAPDTDQGWVYATLTPDAQAVTSAGRLPSCMGCHEKAPADRLFGPKRR